MNWGIFMVGGYRVYPHSFIHFCIWSISFVCAVIISDPSFTSSGLSDPARYRAISMAHWWCGIIASRNALLSVAPVFHSSILPISCILICMSVSPLHLSIIFIWDPEEGVSVRIIIWTSFSHLSRIFWRYSPLPSYLACRMSHSMPFHTPQAYAPTIIRTTITIRTLAHIQKCVPRQQAFFGHVSDEEDAQVHGLHPHSVPHGHEDFLSVISIKIKNKNYFRVAISHVRRSSSIKLSTIRESGEESRSRPQHWRWSRMSSRFADFRSHIAALIWWAISAQYIPPSVISMTRSSVPRAFLSDVMMFFLWCCIMIPYHMVWL